MTQSNVKSFTNNGAAQLIANISGQINKHTWRPQTKNQKITNERRVTLNGSDGSVIGRT